MQLQPRQPSKENSESSKTKRRNAIVKKHSCDQCDMNSSSRQLPNESARGSCIWNAEYDQKTYADHETRAKHYDSESLPKVLGIHGSFDPDILSLIAEGFSTGCILHEAITLGAPDSVLMSLVNCFPSFLTQRDENGRYPVHIACAFGASSEFIFYCIDMNPSSAAAKDIDGKTPVHLLCQRNWNRAQDAKPDSTAEENMRDILCMLYRKAPSSVVSEDNRGVGSVEYAIESNLNINTILLLQEMIGQYKENQARKVTG